MFILFPIKQLFNKLVTYVIFPSLNKNNHPAANHLPRIILLNLTCISLHTPSKTGQQPLWVLWIHYRNYELEFSMTECVITNPVSLHTLIVGLCPAFFVLAHFYISSFIHAFFTYKNSIYSHEMCMAMIKTPGSSELLH